MQHSVAYSQGTYVRLHFTPDHSASYNGILPSLFYLPPIPPTLRVFFFDILPDDLGLSYDIIVC